MLIVAILGGQIGEPVRAKGDCVRFHRKLLWHAFSVHPPAGKNGPLAAVQSSLSVSASRADAHAQQPSWPRRLPASSRLLGDGSYPDDYSALRTAAVNSR